MDYFDFIHSKQQLGGEFGFEPTFIPKLAMPFQEFLIRWSTKKGRSATFADCGLGKSLMQLAWAQNIVEKTNKPVLIMLPLAVGAQTAAEGVKFGVDAFNCRDGKFNGAKVVLTNYERLHYFNRHDFGGVACDESSILKNFDGATKTAITEFMREVPYRALYTATPSPNDFTELGTSSECLGELGYMDMLGRFFKNDQNVVKPMTYRHRGQDFEKLTSGKWRFRGHAEHDFWRWVCSWARSIRKPSDLGFDDAGFDLPKLICNMNTVKAEGLRPGLMFQIPAVSLQEQRAERSRTLQERCEMAAQIAGKDSAQMIAWGNLNQECDLMEKLIPDSKQISGDDTEEEKEEILDGFRKGQFKVLVTKKSIVGWGLNLQFCHRMTYFPDHSFEGWYQVIRRCWRFGQKHDVTVDVIAGDGESRVLSNLQRKEKAAERMFEKIVQLMNDELKIKKQNKFTEKIKLPNWM